MADWSRESTFTKSDPRSHTVQQCATDLSQAFARQVLGGGGGGGEGGGSHPPMHGIGQGHGSFHLTVAGAVNSGTV